MCYYQQNFSPPKLFQCCILNFPAASEVNIYICLVLGTSYTQMDLFGLLLILIKPVCHFISLNPHSADSVQHWFGLKNANQPGRRKRTLGIILAFTKGSFTCPNWSA